MTNVIAIFSGYSRELGGCEIYRTTMPFYNLQQKHSDWKMTWAFIEDIIKLNAQNGTALREIIRNYDIFVFPRLYFKDVSSKKIFGDMIAALHEMNKVAVYELDDDMSNQYRIVHDGDAIEAMKLCDAITVTTPYLAARVEEQTGNRAYVLPNMISKDVWGVPRTGTFRYQDKIVLGLTGSPSHSEDWKVLETVLPEIMQRDDVHLIVMGYHPDYLADLPNTTYFPAVGYENYSQVIKSCDIILAPVNNDPFNLGKSPIKCLEGMAATRILNGRYAGAACIASDHPIYKLAIKNEETGLLVKHTPDAWRDGIYSLILNEKFRQRLQFNGYEWVYKNHLIEKKATLWGNAYQAILDRQRLKITP